MKWNPCFLIYPMQQSIQMRAPVWFVGFLSLRLEGCDIREMIGLKLKQDVASCVRACICVRARDDMEWMGALERARCRPSFPAHNSTSSLSASTHCAPSWPAIRQRALLIMRCEPRKVRCPHASIGGSRCDRSRWCQSNHKELYETASATFSIKWCWQPREV